MAKFVKAGDSVVNINEILSVGRLRVGYGVFRADINYISKGATSVEETSQDFESKEDYETFIDTLINHQTQNETVLLSEIKKLRKVVEELTLAHDYAPGGKIFEDAKKEFSDSNAGFSAS
jgi:hypothetical protein